MNNKELLEFLKDTLKAIDISIETLSGTKNAIADVCSTEWQCIASLDCAGQTITKLIREIEWNAKA